LNGNIITYCPKFVKIQKMFHGKFVIVAEVQLLIKIKTIIGNVNVVDVNVTTRSKATKKQMLKDRKPRKANSVAD
jgi:hypothetical protein